MLKKTKLYLDSEYKFECENKIDYLKLDQNNAMADEKIVNTETSSTDLPEKVKQIGKNGNKKIYRKVSGSN